MTLVLREGPCGLAGAPGGSVLAVLGASLLSCQLNMAGRWTPPDGNLDGPETLDASDADSFDVPEADCPAGLMSCDGECVDLQEDNNNCGACGRVCPSDRTCLAGVCACPPSTTDCDGLCVDLRSSNDHCGACGNRCELPLICNGEGVCEEDCIEGFTRCDGDEGPYCAHTPTDPRNCGFCGHVCMAYDNAAPVCDEGLCTLACYPGYHDLNGIVDDGCEYACVVMSPTEECNGFDDDCNGGIDETFDCEPGTVSDCSSSCGTAGSRACDPSCLWEPCEPPPEECNGLDDDCSGEPDDVFACVRGATVDCINACGNPGLGLCSDACDPPSTAECGQMPPWWNSRYAYRRMVTITDAGGTGVPGDMTVFFPLPAADFSGKIRADGEDARIVRYDGGWTEIPRHAFRPPAGSARMVFMAPDAISPGGSDSSLWFYYGNPAASGAPSGWSNSMGADGPSSVYLAADDFEEHAPGDCPDGWAPCAGVFSVQEVSGRKVLSSTGDGQYIFAGDAAWTDIWFEAVIHSDSWNSGCPGTVSRVVDVSNLVYAGYSCGSPPPAVPSAQAWSRISGNYSMIIWDSVPDLGTDTHLLAMRWLGDTLTLFHDGTRMGEAPVTEPPLSSGKVGMFSSYGTGNRLDIVMVRRAMAVEPAVTLSAEESYCPP
jgi:hypothetical protein